jgi:hypothetical protein
MEATDEQIQTLLSKVFQSPEETIKLLAPDGWENSPYVHYMHPTVEQIFTERMRLFEAHKDSKFFKTEMPVLEDVIKENEETPIKPVYEFLDLFGNCLWKIFSDNHTVFDRDGIEYDLGSFRGTGGTIADFINENFWKESQFGYLDFYCAVSLNFGTPAQNIYELIFTRLKQAGCDWRYSHPRMYLFSFDKEERQPKPEEYDPAKSALEEIEKEKKKQEMKKLRSELDESAEQHKQESFNEPPKTVLAYQNVYGKVPEGFLE